MYEVGQHVILKQGRSLPHISWVPEYMDKYVGTEAVINCIDTSPIVGEYRVYTLHKLNGDSIECWWDEGWLMPANNEVDASSLKAITDFLSEF